MRYGIRTLVFIVALGLAWASWSAESELFPNIRKARKQAQESAASSVVVDEEMIVTAPKPKRGHVPQFEYLLETYKARSKGSLLYRQGKFTVGNVFLALIKGPQILKKISLQKINMEFLYFHDIVHEL